MKNILVVILIIALILISFLLLLKLNFYYQKIEKMKDEQLKRDIKYLKILSNAVEIINKLQEINEKLEVAYTKLKLINTEQELFEVTAYTSNECGTVTKIGVDLEANYSKYLNVCAVDPELIPLGSTVIIRFADGTEKAYFACDTGSAIKGKAIDIYMTDRREAINFGRQNLMVKVVK